MRRSDRPASVAVICVLAFCLPIQGKVIYVSGSATGVNDGSSWANAYNCLQEALASANTADQPVEIRVARGTYTPDRERGIATRDREATFRLTHGITLRGGYAGPGSVDPEAREPVKYVSVLTGDLNGDDALIENSAQMLGEPTRSDNSRHVVTVFVEDSVETGVVLEGFTITAGQDDEVSDLAAEGGAGVLVLSGALTLVDCTVVNNATCNVGGGICATAGCQLTLRNCGFARNDGPYGGGVGTGRLYAVSEGCRLAMTGCTFSGNSAFQGAGLFSYGGSTEATDCAFSDNVAAGDNNAAFGGGMYLLAGDVILTSCSFEGNAADDAGGAISQATAHVQMVSCTFDRNAAGVGGAIDMSACDSLLDGCSFTGNTAASGGGLYCISCPLTLRHCLFVGNGSELTPGKPFDVHGEGGAIYLLGDASLANCTFHGNRAQKGQSLWMSQSDVAITNSILWDDEHQIFTEEGGRPVVTYSDVLGRWPGAGNIEADPCFAQPGYWDPNGTLRRSHDDFWVDGDYHLKSRAGRWDPDCRCWVSDGSSSPCIDAGDPNTPLDDAPQPNGNRINMGAYGGTAEASESFVSPPTYKISDQSEVAGPRDDRAKSRYR